MLEVERQQLMLHHIRVHGSGNVADLAQALGVSPSTVRRDLADLSGRRLLTRVRGGASAADTPLTDPRRAIPQEAQKRRIGAAAADRIADGSTVLLGGGTTTEAMVPFLADKKQLTVLTNALNVATLLGQHREITVVVLGGILLHEHLSLLGPIAQQTLAEFHVEVAIYGAFGIDAEHGLYGARAEQAATDRALLASAAEVTILADCTKFGRSGPVRLVPPAALHRVITDTSTDLDRIQSLRSAGVEVVVC
jgi:DeoR/GlpR family transcriptional regulator of sugar metabolism